MSNWSAYNNGKSIGTLSVEGGLILFDEENADGARITLKRGKGYVSISLNIYGWIDHTRFFNTDSDAQREYRAMRQSVIDVLNLINRDGVSDLKIWEAISEFVRRYP
ncbi:MAG TPA: hypothetical protein PLE14_00080 [Anaerolineales bacterium]|nr:hypothetical protein [Anaerolineales bacterium]HNO31993.1 hypothetical protein [Anaerolineales bacterium]